MARVTIEDCLKVIPNRYKLNIVAFKRVKQLFKGAKPLVDEEDSKITVTALREIAANKIKYKETDSEEYY